MFGWRRRSEGFEWREYVRTTVLVRRADRQRKIDDVREAAVNKVKDTRDRGVAAGRAGVETVADSATSFLNAAAQALGHAIATCAIAAWTAVSAVVGAAGQHIRGIPVPAIRWPSLSLPKSLGIERIPRVGSKAVTDATVMRPDVGFRWPFNPRLLGGVGFAIALIVIGGPMLSSDGSVATVNFVPALTAGSSATLEPPATLAISSEISGTLSGRATAIHGNLLRIGGRVVKLNGIEAPEPQQRCLKSNGRSWNCSASARTALDRLVRRKTVTCAPSGQTDVGHVLATCTVDDADIAATLVTEGHVFAASGMFATYSSQESDARAAKIGLWQGDAVRPDEWRVQVWEDAKRTAPDGCPIKGTVRASDRTYAMPWSQGYDRGTMRTVKGDRWFCSEDEARAAGFRLATRS